MTTDTIYNGERSMNKTRNILTEAQKNKLAVFVIRNASSLSGFKKAEEVEQIASAAVGFKVTHCNLLWARTFTGAKFRLPPSTAEQKWLDEGGRNRMARTKSAPAKSAAPSLAQFRAPTPDEKMAALIRYTDEAARAITSLYARLGEKPPASLVGMMGSRA